MMNARQIIFSLITLISSTGSAFAGTPNPTADFAKQKYESLSSVEFELKFSTVNGPIDGMITTEKSFSEPYSVGFCRKYTPVAPMAISTYTCFSKFSNSDQAEELFTSSTAEKESVASYHNGNLLLGIHHEEKVLQQGGIICTATSPVAPQAIVTYSCYGVEHPPVGGGVSVGN